MKNETKMSAEKVVKQPKPKLMQAYLLKLVKQDYERQHNRDAR